MSNLDDALRYAEMGFHVIPCQPGGKEPLLHTWREFQEQQPGMPEIMAWWSQWPDANLAFVVGRGVVVVDCDGPDALGLLDKAGIVMPGGAPRVRTGNGQHVYLRLPAGITARNRVGFLKSEGGTKSQVDLRADGGYVLAPPSLHPNGKHYEWLVPLKSLAELPLVPDSLLRFKPAAKAAPTVSGGEPGWISQALQGGAPEGQRDDTATRLAGYFVGKGLPEDVVVSLLEGFAARCQPPMSPRDVLRIVSSISRTDARNPRLPEERPTENKVSVEHVSVALSKALDQMQSPQTGIPMPWPVLDQWIVGGIYPGELMYLGGRPGLGKTGMALEIARHAAKMGKRVLAVSREMLSASLARRMIAQEGRINASDLKLGRANMANVCQVSERLSELPLWISDSARSLDDIHIALDQLHGDVDLLLVDYLQLVAAPRQIRERRLQVEHVSQGLKSLALRHPLPLICLSSLSRPSNGTNPRPSLASLRESGELEFDADYVVLLHRENENDDKVMVIVDKGREGARGASYLRFKPEWISFLSMESSSIYDGVVDLSDGAADE